MALIDTLGLTKDDKILYNLLYKKNLGMPFGLGMKLGKKMRIEICSKFDLDTPSYGQFHEEIHKFEFLENEVSKEVLDKVEEYISDL
jgi:hypothetical protein